MARGLGRAVALWVAGVGVAAAEAASHPEAGVLDLVARASPAGGADWACLAEALYFEARGEGVVGQVAVAEVILNRAESGDHPPTVCGVVREGAEDGGGCQFSYRCDGRPEAVQDARAWAEAGRVARAMLDGAPRALTGGAVFYHSQAVSPSWAAAFVRTATVGAHVFYRDEAVLLASAD